jgi:hypothetical protein
MGPLVGGGLGQSEGADYPLRAHRERYLEAVDPLGLGAAPPESGLPGKQPSSAGSHPHHRRDQGGIHDVVDRRRIGERPGQVALQGSHLGLQGAHPPVELPLAQQVREVGAQVRSGEAPEVALAAKPGPLSEDRQRQDFALGKRERATGSLRRGEMVGLPPIVHEDVQ